MLTLFALLAPPAMACGQTTHIWTALHALEHLPPGELADLMTDPEVRGAVVSGTMFPDGGYSPTVGHEYGETAHWEPFQLAYLEHLRDTAGPPWQGDDAKRVAFLLGLAAHGLGDQLFDSMYLYRSDVHDDWAGLGGGQSSADTDTDVVMASLTGGQPINAHWVPYDDLVDVFADQGVDVDVSTMERGMGALDIAVAFVGAAGAQPDQVADAEGRYPWATSHLLDDTMSGSPSCIGITIVAYWQVLFDRLNGVDIDDRFGLATWPADGAHVPARDVDDVDGLVSILFARALEEATIEAPGQVVVTTDEGTDVPIDAWMYYREASNVLDIRSLDGWAEDRDYTITVGAGVRTFDGWTSPTDLQWTFSTKPPPAAPAGEDSEPKRCGCSVAPSASLLWMVAFAAVRRRRQST